MEIRARFPVVDAVMERYSDALGRDRTAYLRRIIRHDCRARAKLTRQYPGCLARR